MNKIFQYIILILLTLFVYSCNNRNTKQMIKDLTNNNFKYWYRYNRDTLKPYSLGFCFYNNGTYIRYINLSTDRKKRTLNNNPVYSKPYWEFIDDTTLLFDRVHIYKIVILNANSLIFQDSKPPYDYFKLHRDNDQDTKIDDEMIDTSIRPSM